MVPADCKYDISSIFCILLHLVNFGWKLIHNGGGGINKNNTN